MFFEYRQNKKLWEGYEKVNLSESLPPGFEYGYEVVNLDKMPIEGEGELEEAPKMVDPKAEPLPVPNKGQIADLDRIVRSKFPNPEEIIDLGKGIRQLRLSGQISDRVKAKHIEALKALGMDDTEAENFFNAQVRAARAAFPKKSGNSDQLAKGAERLQRLIHNSLVLKILTPDGKEVDAETFKNYINEIPDRIISNNAKIDKSGQTEERFYEITLPAYQGLYYDNKDNIFRLLRTCPNAGECKLYCYATKGGYVQYEGTNLRQIRILNYLMNDWKGFKAQVMRELAEAQQSDPKVKLRWHDSGDFFATSYIELAFDVARATPNVTHYAYTKSVGLVNKLKDKKPQNFIFNYSEGGKMDKHIKDTDKNSKVIPKVLWKDLFNKEDFKDPEKLNQLKQRLADTYSKKGLTKDNILTYDEMMNTPESDEPRWHVIVTPKDGDDSASRRDVISTLLLVH